MVTIPETWALGVLEPEWAKSLKTDESGCPAWAKGWLAVKNYFQPMFLGSMVVPSGAATCLTLSDNGSSIAFCDETYMGEIGLQASGQWQGLIETINSCTEVSTPFFKLEIRLENSTYVLFVLICQQQLTSSCFKKLMGTPPIPLRQPLQAAQLQSSPLQALQKVVMGQEDHLVQLQGLPSPL